MAGIHQIRIGKQGEEERRRREKEEENEAENESARVCIWHFGGDGCYPSPQNADPSPLATDTLSVAPGRRISYPSPNLVTEINNSVTSVGDG